MKFDMEDPRWTQHAFGELDGQDRDELEQMLATDPQARSYFESLRDAIGTIEREVVGQPAPIALDDVRRARIHKAAARSKRRWWMGASVVAAGAAAAGTLVVMQSPSREVMAVQTPDRHDVSGVSGGSAISHERFSPQQPAFAGKLREKLPDTAQLQLARQQAIEQARAAGILGSTQGDNSGETVHNTEGYNKIDDNPFFKTNRDPLSTFSIDVDTASYANVRRYLEMGQLPPADAVRIEEMINYFHYDYAEPAGSEPFSITTEVGPTVWDAKHKIVRIGIHAPSIPASQIPPRNLVFLVDTSGSMQAANKLPLLKRSLELVVETLRSSDRVAIVAYAGSAGLVLAPTSDKAAILDALARLEAGGSTNGGAGIQLAYKVAAEHFVTKGINRVILCSDGDYNVGVTSDGDLTRLIERERTKGVFLTVLGFGMGNYKDSTMERLADRGNGNYAYIDSLAEARKVLVTEAGGTFAMIAKDVKIQVEFNPATVAGYRLIGYENRVLAHRDFNDDTKDAGDIGAGHTVTALYEVIPAGESVPGPNVDDLKYQTKTTPTGGGSELMTVKVRYKAPDGNTSKLLSRVVDGESAVRDLAATSVDFRWASAIAGFGMMLRSSPHRGQLSWSDVTTLAGGALGSDREGYRKQAIDLIGRAAKLATKP